MLKFEVIKFEAQDVITTSGGVVALPTCSNPSGHSMSFNNVNGTFEYSCVHCGYTNTISNGTIVGGGG